jgi:uncharacterized membrane protein (Fun14 family)
MFVLLDLWGEIMNFVGNGTVIGLPTIAFMAIPLIIGLIVGFLVKKFLKWAIIAAVIVFVLAYFGVWGLSFSKLEEWATTYGAIATQQAIIVIGILPLGIGFVIGLILGFIFG